MDRWRELLFDNGFEEHYHVHIGMRMIKTVIAILVCGLIGWVREGSMAFFSMIAAIMCIQKSTEATIKNSFNRVIGTAIGGAFGVVVLFLETHLHIQRFLPAYILVISLMLIPIMVTTLAIHKPTVTGFSCIVFLSVTVYHVTDASPYAYAMDRLLDTILGIIVALVINLAMPGTVPIKTDEDKAAKGESAVLVDTAPEAPLEDLEPAGDDGPDGR